MMNAPPSFARPQAHARIRIASTSQLPLSVTRYNTRFAPTQPATHLDLLGSGHADGIVRSGPAFSH